MKNFDKNIIQLVSYPRAGSHWVRMVMEKYLGAYCLPTSFYNSKLHWGFHLHDREVGNGDEGITEGFDRVIYLYRNPVDVVYSLLKYEGWGNDRRGEIIEEYKIHLSRWLNNNSDIKHITFIKYEDIKADPVSSFTKILEFMGFQDVREDTLAKICNESTLENLKQSIGNDSVINKNHFGGDYKTEREKFRDNYGSSILKEFEGLWL
tara:strand:+ start:11507 stop:12127 length:621 start_codon:yes stop_codon:yes gene_type:complete